MKGRRRSGARLRRALDKLVDVRDREELEALVAAYPELRSPEARAEVEERRHAATGDSGCLMHLAGRMHRTGAGLRPVHLAVLLAEAKDLLPRKAPQPS